MLKYRARYQQEPEPGSVAPITIELPDGSSVTSDDASVNQQLSDALGKPVRLWSLQPKTNLKHYRLAQPAGAAAMKK